VCFVGRVNPLFHEGDEKLGCGDPKSRFLYHCQHQQHGSPEFPDKSASSGYGSPRYNSSSESGAEEPTETAILRDDAITVLEQNVGYVKSILVAVRGNNSSPRRHNRRPSAATLSPIPEGKVDYCIPRPVWPRDGTEHAEGPQSSAPPDSIVDDALLLYTSFTYTPSDQYSVKSMENARPSNHTNISSHELLRELSDTISQAIEGKQNSTSEDVMKMNLKLESLQRNPSSEEILRKFSVTLSHREPLAKMSRALSNSSSSSGGSLRARPSDERETARLLLLQRLEDSARTSRAVTGSSSSSTSSSGFSDLTQTTPSSSSSRRLPQPPVFLHEDLSSVPTSVRNALIYGTLCKLNGAYEKLRRNEKREHVTEGQQQQDRTYSGAGVATGDVLFKSCYYVSKCECDFGS